MGQDHTEQQTGTGAADGISIAIVAPSPVPFTPGGAENLWYAWLGALNSREGIRADLIKLPSPEADFWSIVGSYRRFSELRLDHFDRVISTKYPAWMVSHGDHHVYMQHKLRGLYDTWPASLSTAVPEAGNAAVARALRALDAAHGERNALPDIFAALAELQDAADDLPAELFALPGALIRRVVHALDDIGLARHAIRRYGAISHTVAQRSEYFPTPVDPVRDVEVIHHDTLPRSAAPGARILPATAIFSASRLEWPKRMDLLIEAHRRAAIDAPLYIAGDGPRAAALAAQAAASEGSVTLMGRLSDGDLAAAYAQADFVAYVPDREDYGLITLEALQAGRPVLTCSDSGGVTELVRDGENGLIVEPDADALAGGLRRLATDRPLRDALAARAAQSVAHIDWAHLVDRFSAAAPRVALIRVCAGAADGWPAVPAAYRELARQVDLRCISLMAGDRAADPEQNVITRRRVSPGLVEVLVPMSVEQRQLGRDLAGRGLAPGPALAALLAPSLTPLWAQQVAQAAAWADGVILGDPWSVGAVHHGAAQFSQTPYWMYGPTAADETAIDALAASDAAAGERARRLVASCREGAVGTLGAQSCDDGEQLTSTLLPDLPPTPW